MAHNMGPQTVGFMIFFFFFIHTNKMNKAEYEKKWYAVKVGRNPGVYETWTGCKEQTFRFPKAVFKSFTSREEAQQFVDSGAFSHEDKKIDTALVSPDCVVYTDGSAEKARSGQPGAASAAVWFGPNNGRNIAAEVPGKPTNQRAEAYAIYLALEHSRLIPGVLEIRSDSMYSICSALQLHTVAANLDIFEIVWDQMAKRRARGDAIQFVHVPAHTGIVGNEAADKMAKQFVRRLMAERRRCDRSPGNCTTCKDETCRK